MLVEEVPKSTTSNATTVYFSSSINLTARSLNSNKHQLNESGDGPVNKKGRTKVNYNLNQLFNAQTSANNDPKNSGPSKSVQQIQLEKLVQKRLNELNQETSTKGFELPKNFVYTSIHSVGNKRLAQKSRLGNTPATKRILAARRNLNSYFEEERNLISINTILSSNFQFVDLIDFNNPKSTKSERSRPKLRLCCICGSKSNYSRCPSCVISLSCCKSCEKSNGSKDFSKLEQFANLASVGYCVTKGLSTGVLSDPNTNCPLEACQNSVLKDVEIIRIFDFNTLNEVGTGFYAVDHKRKTIILVFRGSASRRDWVTDLNFFPCPYEPIVFDKDFKDGEPYITTECVNCKVHRGFYNFLKDNSGAIISAGIKMKEKFPTYSFLIIGHSLGAAFTVMSGIEFLLLGYDPLVVTFGGPKVGNEEFCNFMDDVFDTEEVAKQIDNCHDFTRGFIRVVHRHDIVPSLPPMFAHAGYEYFIDKKDLPHEECDLDRRGMCHSGLLTKRDSSSLSKRDFGLKEFKVKPSFFWPNKLGKFEHTHYFRKITNCQGNQ
ncbi:uncharacterized protein KGF55_003208 [Candida pseudojiufengensis]|uniref:uncharacterized protein n=1 Tax=Candida pseudojiufengensis TaxID=497109 RepID=UPI0022256BD5|nr:uncharacterized protein KGF55_003208 [Candida pseudojiufengensis]KAI5962132.1 hypothetical protein KGF55_003208 [Candida pseudojiufengensis]